MKFKDIYNLIIRSNLLIVYGSNTLFLRMGSPRCSLLKYFNCNVLSIETDFYIDYQGCQGEVFDAIKIVLEA